MPTLKLTMSDLRSALPKWFSPENKRFFGDVSYKVLKGQSKKLYLIRSTYAWSDMFGQPKTLHYRINPIEVKTIDDRPDAAIIDSDHIKIGQLIDTTFNDMDEVKNWLNEN